MADYTSMKLPKILSAKIENLQEYKNLGYRSVSEWCLSKIRIAIDNEQKGDNVNG